MWPSVHHFSRHLWRHLPSRQRGTESFETTAPSRAAGIWPEDLHCLSSASLSPERGGGRGRGRGRGGIERWVRKRGVGENKGGGRGIKRGKE